MAGTNDVLALLALLLFCSTASAGLLASISPNEPGQQATLLYPGETGLYKVDIFNDSTDAAKKVLVKVSASEGLKIIDAGVEKSVFAAEIASLGPGEKKSLLVSLRPAEADANKLFVYVDYGIGAYTNMSATYVNVRESPLAVSSGVSKALLGTGEEGSISLSMKNNGPEPLRNIKAELLAFEGIESKADPVFVAELAPGETYEAKAFAFRPDPEATGKKPLVMQISFEDSLGKHLLEKNLSIEIRGNQPIILLTAAIIILIAAVAIFSWFRGAKKQSKPEGEETKGKK